MVRFPHKAEFRTFHGWPSKVGSSASLGLGGFVKALGAVTEEAVCSLVPQRGPVLSLQLINEQSVTCRGETRFLLTW